MVTPQGPAARVRALREALDGLSNALAVPDLAALTATEGKLAAAVADLSSQPPTLDSLAETSRVALREELLAAAAALARCRRLGGSLADVVHDALEARGLAGGYGCRGEEAPHVPSANFGVRG